MPSVKSDRRPSAAELTVAMVRIPSESSDPVASDPAEPERAVADLLAESCRACGIITTQEPAIGRRCNLVARVPRPGAPRVLIAGHLDTVSARGMDGAFDGVIADGWLRGRGACDDKGPLAAAFTAVANLLGDGRRPACDLTLLATADEEAGMAGARAWAAAGAPADLVLVLEPTELRPVVAHKGVYRARIRTTGRACHSSRPGLGSNAVEAMLPVLSAVVAEGRALALRTDGLIGPPTLAVTGIAGGSAINVVPDACEALIDVRLVPSLPPLEMEERLVACCPGALVAGIFSAPALARGTPGSGTGERFIASLRAVGVDPAPTVAPWCSDASFLQRLGPCLVWGPGRIEDAHTVHERIATAELERAVEALTIFLGEG